MSIRKAKVVRCAHQSFLASVQGRDLVVELVDAPPAKGCYIQYERRWMVYKAGGRYPQLVAGFDSLLSAIFHANK